MSQWTTWPFSYSLQKMPLLPCLSLSAEKAFRAQADRRRSGELAQRRYLRILLLAAIIALLIGRGIAVAGNAACSPVKKHEVLSPAGAGAREVTIDCTLTLKRGDVVTKRLILEGRAATGATISCNGATFETGPGSVNFGPPTIEIRSAKYRDAAMGPDRWEAPRDITITGCNIIGSIRIWGMAPNGQGADLRTSSRLPGHTARAQANAPADILLDRLTITGVGNIPLYLAPGVTRVKLADSELKGKSDSVAIYLDAESADNTIFRNYIHTATGRGREVMAIDGSSSNRVINNRFSALSDGGIYLYRNCGEGGTIRHATPSYNQIINNVFYYDRYRGSNPAVFLGSRDGNRRYCDADKGYPFGSSVSDLDYATYNAVMQNRIYKLPVAEMIRTQHVAVNGPNYIEANETVGSAAERRAGCFVAGNAGKKFILDGETVAVQNNIDSKSCRGGILRCLDGELSCPAQAKP